ncbi:hypothetical protein AM587_10010061 [Phytophthora nicotianae]|uniref:Uncharacterized protein n=1 Tax=Phytophthora nicotianae TaxID=4792 RepID=A0A0W8DVD8_PHYNI|nr:hypothetical protein AM587_10010061 [Phytophthora nicotianae]
MGPCEPSTPELLAHGADPFAANDDGKTPLELIPEGEMREQIEKLVADFQHAISFWVLGNRVSVRGAALPR